MGIDAKDSPPGSTGSSLWLARKFTLPQAALAGVVIWTAVMAAMLSWERIAGTSTTRRIAQTEARAHFNKDQAFRRWATTHGGVYVPTDERTPPHPDLSHVPERDLETPSGHKLTLMNPAYMLRQMMAEFPEINGIRGRITSLKPLSPGNAPDAWEADALRAFERGVAEVSEFTDIDGEPFLRLMRPMIVQQECLKCHAAQGYRVGDVRGGVGVSLAMAPLLAEQRAQSGRIAANHGLIWLLGLAGLGFAYVAATRRAEERAQSQETLLTRENHSQSLLRLSRRLELAQTRAEALNAAQDEIKAILGYQRLWLYLFSEDKKYASSYAAFGSASAAILSEDAIATLTVQGDRMLEEIADAKQIVVVEDARTDERTNREIVAKIGNRTIVNVPVVLFDNQLGSIATGTFGDEGVRIPTQLQREYLTAMASHMAVALDRLHLLAERQRAQDSLREAFRRAQHQQEVIAILATSPALRDGDVDSLARELTERASQVLGVERAGVWLFDETGTQLCSVDLYRATPASHSSGELFLAAQFQSEFDALKTSKYVDAHDTMTDPRTASFAETFLKPQRITSMLDAVLRVSGRDLGTLCLEHVDRSHHWETDEIAFACQLADQLTLAVLNRERRQAQEALRLSEARFRAMAEMQSDYYWELDREYHYTFIAGRGLAPLSAKFGRDLTQLVGRHYDEFKPLKIIEPPSPELEAIMERRLRCRDALAEITAPDGSRVYLRVSAEPFVDENGEFAGYRGASSDVTEILVAEQRMKQISTAIEHSPVSIVITDADGRIEYVNPHFETVSGYRREEVLGRNPRMLGAGTTPNETYRELWETINSGRIWRGELQNKRRNGELFIERASIAPIYNPQGRITHFVGVKDDITVMESLEAQLRQAQKMEALGTFAGGIAHDFNNIILAIGGNVELARRDIGPTHAALVSLEEIAKASWRAKELVQQILTFSRRQPTTTAVISLAAIVDESTRLLRAALPAGVDLRVESAADAPAVVADATQVEQILLNLCGNAYQAAQGQGRPGVVQVRLQAHEQAADEANGDLPPGRYACLTVADNGPGIDEAVKRHIFEPFFTTKQPGAGTGLGLAVVYGIVQRHGARITVASDPGRGSTFRVYFPAADVSAVEAAVPVPDIAPAQGRGKRVLYIDDDESIVFLMQRLLTGRGYRVSAHTDASAALDEVRAGPEQFDLAVTDYNMPGATGLEVARELRALRADLPVAVATGYITEELRTEAPAAGVTELIYKPNTVDELCAAIARLAQSHPDRPDPARGERQ